MFSVITIYLLTFSMVLQALTSCLSFARVTLKKNQFHDQKPYLFVWVVAGAISLNVCCTRIFWSLSFTCNWLFLDLITPLVTFIGFNSLLSVDLPVFCCSLCQPNISWLKINAFKLDHFILVELMVQTALCGCESI